MTLDPDNLPDLWPLQKRSLIAILRGIKPEETRSIVLTLVEAGFEAIEIPLNSPRPYESIEIAAKSAPDNVLIGAGTVLSSDQVVQLHNCGGKLLVSPNVDGAVLTQAAKYSMVTMPGVFTATECFLALEHGAAGLKFFPASVLGPQGIKAITTVLPSGTIIGAVGGVSDTDFEAYGAAGIRTFGLGSSLYKPGDDVIQIRETARRTIAAYDKVFER